MVIPLWVFMDPYWSEYGSIMVSCDKDRWKGLQKGAPAVLSQYRHVRIGSFFGG